MQRNSGVSTEGATDAPPSGNMNLWSEYDGRLAAVWGEIVEHGLEKHVGELEALGYTVVDPQVPAGIIEAMRESVFRKAEAHWGSGARDGSVFAAEERDFDITPTIRIGDVGAEPALVAAVTNARTIALVRYLCGWNARLSNVSAFYKAKGHQSPLHIDSEFPDPMPQWDYVCNAAWLLTDVNTPEDGALSFVPGSHRFRRPQPLDVLTADQRLVPVLARAGSVVLFRGSTWHGTHPKTTGGIRTHVALFYARDLVHALPEFPVPDEVLASIPAARRSVLVSPARFQQLIEQRLDRPDGGRGDLVLSLSEDPGWMSMLEADSQRQRGAGSQYA
jgi:ectoine hydroxylase-related dioxygenase (phytanoyl-CoA dioxygenase family)